MQTQQTITFFGTVSNSATSRISKTGRKFTAFGVSIISDRDLQAFHYNVVAFGKQGHFAKQLQTGTRIKLVVQAQSQPDNIAIIPLFTATFVRPVRPVARGWSSGRLRHSRPGAASESLTHEPRNLGLKVAFSVVRSLAYCVHLQPCRQVIDKIKTE
jgi:hypothetical protein